MTMPTRLFSRSRSCSPRPAFTLIELLVVIAIIGLLIGMMVPAVQGLRDVARRAACQENLSQISMALSAYHLDYGRYPAGTINTKGPIESLPVGYHHNWIEGILPQLDAMNLWEAIDRSASVYAPENEPLRLLQVPRLRCPSASIANDNASCYAGVTRSVEAPIDVSGDGVFVLNRTFSDDDITDGLSYTFFVGEKLQGYAGDLGWLSGTRATLRTTGHAVNADRNDPPGVADPANLDPLFVGGFASGHSGGAYFATGAGEIRFVSDSTDVDVLAQKADRSDGAVPADWKTEGNAAASEESAEREE